jgi:hypothetical protein
MTMHWGTGDVTRSLTTYEEEGGEGEEEEER